MANIEFEDVRVTFDEHKAMKKDFNKEPLGQLPTLTIGDKVICQSAAIIRYTAKLAGLYPEGKKYY